MRARFRSVVAAAVRHRRRRPAWLVGASGLALAGCTVPNFEGAQLQDPPQGFLIVQGTAPMRPLISGHQPVVRTAWVESGVDASTIFIDGWPAVLGYDDAVVARDESALYARDPDTRVGEVEGLTVDGRDAWGWEERVETPARGLVWVAYRALVPYDTITYTIEFASGNPTFKRTAPDTLKAVIASFGIGRTTYNLPLIALGGGLVLFALGVMRTKRQERAARARSINLVKIPKKKDEKPGQPTLAGSASASQPPSAAPAAPAQPAPAARPIPDWRGPTSPPKSGQPPSGTPTK